MAASDRVALITGAGSGLGRAIARALAHEGIAIAAVDINEDGLRSLAVELAREQKRCAWAVADVTDVEDIKKSTRELEGQLGPIDLLVANAGIALETTASNFNPRDIARIIEVNLTGVSNSIAAVLPDMLERRRGHLVAISSLRVELRDKGIAVTTICPGWIRTPMTENIVTPMPGIMESEVAARHVCTQSAAG